MSAQSNFGKQFLHELLLQPEASLLIEGGGGKWVEWVVISAGTRWAGLEVMSQTLSRVDEMAGTPCHVQGHPFQACLPTPLLDSLHCPTQQHRAEERALDKELNSCNPLLLLLLPFVAWRLAC